MHGVKLKTFFGGMHHYHSGSAGYLSNHHQIDIGYKTRILHENIDCHSEGSKQVMCHFLL